MQCFPFQYSVCCVWLHTRSLGGMLWPGGDQRIGSDARSNARIIHLKNVVRHTKILLMPTRRVDPSYCERAESPNICVQKQYEPCLCTTSRLENEIRESMRLVLLHRSNRTIEKREGRIWTKLRWEGVCHVHLGTVGFSQQQHVRMHLRNHSQLGPSALQPTRPSQPPCTKPNKRKSLEKKTG